MAAVSGNLHRAGDREDRRVTNIELFFDLVYVFAVTQLSHYLLAELTVTGALQALLLLTMVWLVWAYTSWVTNWLDPDRTPVRLMLVALMLGSLVLSAGLPHAFTDRGLWVGGSYAAMQIGRSAFAVAGLAGHPLQRNFQRILSWCLVSGLLAVLGGFAHGDARAGLWAAAVVVDLLGGTVGFYTPGLGRSSTADWTISGHHIAERCQAFMLIALGESVVVIGSRVAGLSSLTGAEIGAFATAFLGVVALWWVYFDRSAEASAAVIARSADPGRLGRSAYHFIHPVMVAGIIVIAAADERVLREPTAGTTGATAWLVLGGTALFLAGHAAFKLTVWRVVPASRLAAIVLLALLGIVATSVRTLLLGAIAAAVVIGVAAADRLTHPADSAAELPADA